MNKDEVLNNFGNFRGFKEAKLTIFEKIKTQNPNFDAPYEDFDIVFNREGTLENKILKVVLTVKNQQHIKEKYSPTSHKIEFNANDFDVMAYIQEANIPHRVKLGVTDFESDYTQVKSNIISRIAGNYIKPYIELHHKTNTKLKALVFFEPQTFIHTVYPNNLEGFSQPFTRVFDADNQMVSFLAKRDYGLAKVEELLQPPEGKDPLTPEFYDLRTESIYYNNVNELMEQNAGKKFITHVVWIYSDEEIVTKDLTTDITNNNLTFTKPDLEI